MSTSFIINSTQQGFKQAVGPLGSAAGKGARKVEQGFKQAVGPLGSAAGKGAQKAEQGFKQTVGPLGGAVGKGAEKLGFFKPNVASEASDTFRKTI
jgi:hypothetical protein